MRNAINSKITIRDILFSLILLSLYSILYRFPYLSGYTFDVLPNTNVRELFIHVSSLGYTSIGFNIILSFLIIDVLTRFIGDLYKLNIDLEYEEEEKIILLNYFNIDTINVLRLDCSNPFLGFNKIMGLRE